MGNIFGKVGNMLGTKWEHHQNMLGTTKIHQTHPRSKKSDCRVHAASTHCPQEILLPTFVLCHLWPRLMAVA
jgi:hypothetical protein